MMPAQLQRLSADREQSEKPEPSPVELLKLLQEDLKHIELRVALLRMSVNTDEFLRITELPEVLEEMQATAEDWQEELSEQLEGIRASELEPEEEEENLPGPRDDRDYARPSDEAPPQLTGSGEPPPHDDADAPPPEVLR